MLKARFLLLALPSACLIAACRTETTRPQPELSDRTTRPAAQSPARATPTPTHLPQGAPRPESGGGAGGKPGQGEGAGEARYLPPSEHGAYVEMIETPAGGEVPRGRDAAAANPGGQAERDQGGIGGNVPHSLPAEARQGEGGGLPAQGNSGRQPSEAHLPAQAGVELAPGVAVPPAQAAGSLEQDLAEFRRLMARAEAAAAAERASSPEGERGHRGGRLEPTAGGYGAGGAAARATGLGASPDLSGEADGAPRAGGSSAVQPAGTTDGTVVARQLREAAEREPDPVLRDKLWMEYRNYTRH